MPAQDTGIGDRIRRVRKRRGLTQKQLADRSGLSLSWIKRVEEGSYESEVRVQTARRIAVALGVPTTALIASMEPEEDRTADSWDRLRDAIGATAEPPSTANGGSADFAAALAEAVTLYQDHRYDDLARVLPPLVTSADEPLLRSRTLGLAASVLIQTRHRETAAAALDTAMNAAEGSEMDEVAIVNTRCWLLILERRFAEVMELASGWADRVEPRLSKATALELSAWGWLLLRGSAAAIRDNRPAEAEDMMRLAEAAAAAIRPGGPAHPHWSLGNLNPALVVMKRAENALVDGRPDVTLRLADRVPRGLRSMDNRNRHLLDVSAAHVELRDYDEAFGVLRQLRAESGPWLAEQRMTHDILGRIIEHRRTLTPEMREMADAVRMPLLQPVSFPAVVR